MRRNTRTIGTAKVFAATLGLMMASSAHPAGPSKKDLDGIAQVTAEMQFKTAIKNFTAQSLQITLLSDRGEHRIMRVTSRTHACVMRIVRANEDGPHGVTYGWAPKETVCWDL